MILKGFYKKVRSATMTRGRTNKNKVLKVEKIVIRKYEHKIVRLEGIFVTFNTKVTKILKTPMIKKNQRNQLVFSYFVERFAVDVIKTCNTETERRKIPKDINAILNARLKEEKKLLKAQKTLAAKILRKEKASLLKKDKKEREERARNATANQMNLDPDCLDMDCLDPDRLDLDCLDLDCLDPDLNSDWFNSDLFNSSDLNLNLNFEFEFEF
jgi:hypothetical protein